MAAEKFAEKVGQIHARYIGVATQIALGASTLLTPPTVGTTYSFVEAQLHIPSGIIGLIFIVTGIVAGVTENKWVYWIAGVSFFLVYSLIAFWGAINHLVSFQAGVIYLALALYAFVAFPRGSHGR